MNSGASIRGARNPEEVQEFIRFLFGSDMERQEEEPRSGNGITSVTPQSVESGGSSSYRRSPSPFSPRRSS